MEKTNHQLIICLAAKAIAGTTGAQRDEAISAFLRAAMIMLLVG